MKKITIIFSFIMLLGSVKAQNTVNYLWNTINVTQLHNVIGSNFADTLKKYHLCNCEQGSTKVITEAIKQLGQTRVGGLMFGAETDTNLSRAFHLINVSVNTEKQKELIDKLYWEAHPIYWDSFANDTIIGWSNEGGRVSVIAIAFNYYDSTVIGRKKNGIELLELNKKSIRLADSIEISKYF